MPHCIINKLNQLMEKEFPSQLNTPNPYLGKGPTTLPPDVLELVDDVVDEAVRILGVRQLPTTTQLRVMADAGFKVTHDGVKIGNAWKTGVIHTPKGLINYW